MPKASKRQHSATHEDRPRPLAAEKLPIKASLPTYLVHRYRWLEYMPSAIYATALSPADSQPYFAVARGNGDIELWNIASDWQMERKIPGNRASPIQCLAWSSYDKEYDIDDVHCTNADKASADAVDRECKRKDSEDNAAGVTSMARLFSAGNDGMITEWDLTKLCAKSTASSYGGAIWCMTVSNDQRQLVIACEDGHLRLYRLLERSGLEYVRSIGAHKEKILSLAWGRSDHMVLSGSADGVIQFWDSETGRATKHITVDAGAKEGPVQIWSLMAIGDGLVVSGDSHGRVHFWDSSSGTLVTQFASHDGNVLALASNSCSSSVFSAGVDSKIVRYVAIRRENSQGGWVMSGVSRVHSHEVRSLVYSHHPSMPEVLLSGGIDTEIHIHHAPRWPMSGKRRLSPFASHPVVSLSKSQHQLLLCTDSSLELWKLGEPGNTLVRMAPEPAPPQVDVQWPAHKRLVVQLPASEHNLVTAILSESAHFIAASTRHTFYCYVFSLKRYQWMRQQPTPMPCARIIRFSQDERRLLLVTFDNRVQIYHIETDDEHAGQFEFVLAQSLVPFSTDEYVIGLSVSSDSKYIAVAILTEAKVFLADSGQMLHHLQFATEPNIKHVHFHHMEAVVVVTFVNNVFQLYNVHLGRYDPWTLENVPRLSPKYTEELGQASMGLAQNPRRPAELLFWGVDFMTWFDLSRHLRYSSDLTAKGKNVPDRDPSTAHVKRHRPTPKALFKSQFSIPVYGQRGRLSKEAPSGPLFAPERMDLTVQEALSQGGDAKDLNEPPSCIMDHKYRPLLFADFLDDGSLVIVERPWTSVLSRLPAPHPRTRYGS